MESGEGDVRLARLVSLAGQKFLSDVLADTMSHWRLSTAQATGLLAKPTPSSSSSSATPSAATDYNHDLAPLDQELGTVKSETNAPDTPMCKFHC